MRKTAPGWGKAIGIIMICLGGLGVFFHIYKIIFPLIFAQLPNTMEQISRLNPDHSDTDQIVINQFNNLVGMSDTEATVMSIFGVLGILLTVFYIIGGVKLLSVKPANYNFAKYALIVFISYNALGCMYFYFGDSNIIVKGIMIYAIIGLVFDLTLIIILASSNKADYGIGIDNSMQDYTINSESDEIL